MSTEMEDFIKSKAGEAYIADAIAWAAANGLQMASDSSGIDYVHTPLSLFPSKVRQFFGAYINGIVFIIIVLVYMVTF